MYCSLYFTYFDDQTATVNRRSVQWQLAERKTDRQTEPTRNAQQAHTVNQSINQSIICYGAPIRRSGAP